ncbi:MAG: hypothetical protein KF741_12040 [Ferruginibacter sp.]|nr:hypothetical protein [Bacteroidota bacterium]MBX2919965.1 hypothetical protein [Ferruginibacter sp.]MCB0710170.1 hypothetical protein [Chitinophagaceae bacterium]
MIPLRRYVILFLLFIQRMNLTAQDLTGTWEGDMGTYQFLQVNIIQNGNNICGYTWDHINYDQNDFCKAFFEATFDKKNQKFILNGTSFIANSGNHILMHLDLRFKYVNNQPVLYYNPTRLEIMTALMAGETVQSRIYLRKVSNKPALVLPHMRDCMNEKLKKEKPIKTTPKKPVDTVAKVKVPEKPKDTVAKVKIPKKPVDTLAKEKIPEKPKDTIVTIQPPPKDTPVTEKIIEPSEENTKIPNELDKRKNSEQSHIVVDTKFINLKVYDNAIVDDDTVSIFYNGKLLLSHQPLTEKAIDIDLTLDENETRHEIILFAENLGSIPPNTALVVITAGNKRYELFASASLKENAVLVLEYRPK